MFTSIQLNGENLSVASSPISVKSSVGIAKLVIRTDFPSRWCRVSLTRPGQKRVDIKPIDNGVTYDIPISDGVTSLDIEHWVTSDDVSNVSYLITSKQARPKTLPQWGGVDITSKMIARAPDAIHDLSLANNRVWCGPGGFAPFKKLPANAIDAIKVYELIGAVPVFCFAQGDKDGALSPELCGVAGERAVDYMLNAVDSIIKIADANPKTAEMTVVLELGNEPDLEPNKYWIGDIQSYIDSYLKPVYLALKARFGERVKIISAGFSWDADLLIQFIEQIAQYCDYIGFHGYIQRLADFGRYENVIGAANKVGRVVWLTECALGYGKPIKAENDSKRKRVLQDAWVIDTQKFLEKLALIGVQFLSYYCMQNVNNSTNAGAALLDSAYKKTKFYDSFLAAKKNVEAVNEFF